MLITSKWTFSFSIWKRWSTKCTEAYVSKSFSIQCQFNGKTRLFFYTNVCKTFDGGIYESVFRTNDQTNICKWTNSLYQKLKSNWLYNKDFPLKIRSHISLDVFRACVSESFAIHWVRQANKRQWKWIFFFHSLYEHKLLSITCRISDGSCLCTHAIQLLIALRIALIKCIQCSKDWQSFDLVSSNCLSNISLTIWRHIIGFDISFNIEIFHFPVEFPIFSCWLMRCFFRALVLFEFTHRIQFNSKVQSNM